MEGLFETEKARRRRLPPDVRRLIVDLKAEYPPFNLNEIANVVCACFGRRMDVRSVKRVLDEEAIPLKLERNYLPYHEMEAASPGQGRAALVELRVDGWSAKAIAGYLGTGRSTECDPPAGVSSVGRLRAVKGHTLFETSIILGQLRLFDLGEALGEEGWIKAIKLDEYAPRLPHGPDKLQQVLFPYAEAI